MSRWNRFYQSDKKRGRGKEIPAPAQHNSKRKAILWATIGVVLGAIFFLLPTDVKAQTTVGVNNWIVRGLGTITQLAVEFLGKILIAIIDMLVKVAQYNEFADSDAVNIGWVVVRDVANMLFIVSLIVISFGTILQWDQYRYNRLLGKLVLTAVLINFSKAITLFLIDFSQVIMLTFVNAFKDVAAGNLTTGFGIRALLSYSNSSTSVEINLESTVLVYALAVIILLIACIVTITLVVVLVRRIISLWIIIILSPLAFISSIMPGGIGSYNSDWWRRLGTELFVGPALAFFLWLTFSIIFLTSGQGSEETATIVNFGASGEVILKSNGEVQATVSQIGSTRNLFNFIATIALLIHSMSIAKTAGGFAGNFAGKMSGLIDKGGSKLVKGIGKAPKKVADWTGATGLAKRAGFGAADAALGLGSKIPLVGNRIAVTRGRLAGVRKRSEEQDKRDLANVDKNALVRMANGSTRTERGRALRKGAIESLMDSGDSDDLTEKARMDYKKYIGYKETVGADGKLKRTAQDQLGYTRLKKMLKDHPEYWMDGMYGQDKNGQRIQLKDAALTAATIAKFKSEVKKMSKAQILAIDNDALDANKSPDLVREELYNNFQEQYGDQFTRDANGKITGSRLQWWNEMNAKQKEFYSGPLPAGANKEEKKRAFSREQEKRKQLGIDDPSIDPQKASEYAKQASVLIIPAATPMEQEIKSRLDAVGDDKIEKQKIAKEYEDFANSDRLSKVDPEIYKKYSKNPILLNLEGEEEAEEEKNIERKEKLEKLKDTYGLNEFVDADDIRRAADAYELGLYVLITEGEIKKAFYALKNKKTTDEIYADMSNYERARKNLEAGFLKEDLIDKKNKKIADATPEQRQEFQEEQKLREGYGLTKSVGATQMREAAQAYKQNSLQDLPQEVQQAFNSQLQKNKTPDQIASDMDAYARETSYNDEQEYEQARRTFEQLIRQQGNKEDDREIIGADSFVRRAQAEATRADREGRSETNFIKADLDKLGFSGRGLHMGDLTNEAEKEKMASGLEEMYRKQLTEAGAENQEVINQKVQEFGESVRSAQNLAFINTKAVGYTDMHTARHERSHSEIDKLSSANQEELFGRLAQTEQDKIIADVAKQWNLNNLPADKKRERAIEEYLTEGLANYGRSDAVGSELDPDLALALKSKGVRFRSYVDQSQMSREARSSTASREKLESQRRAQESRVTEAEKDYQTGVATIAPQLPEGVTSENVTNPDPLVQKEVREKGTSVDVINAIQDLHNTLKAEKSALQGIKYSIQKQIQEDEKNTDTMASVIQSGLKESQAEMAKGVRDQNPSQASNASSTKK